MDIPQSFMLGQERQQISELQFDKFPTPSSFSCWKIGFKTQVISCSDFPSEAMIWIKQVEMVYSTEELKSSRPVVGKNFPNFEMLDAEDCLCFEQDHPKLPLQEEAVSRNRKPRKRTDFDEEDRPPS